MTGFTRLDRLRRGGTLTRYHTHRVVRPQNVAEHSFGVAMIARHLWLASGLPMSESALYYLTFAALEHDLAEFESGDSPAPAKRRSPALRAALHALEEEVNERLGITTGDTLDPFEAAILGAADELDFLWYSLDERRLGNTDFERTFLLGVLGFEERLRKIESTVPGCAAWIKEASILAADLRVAMKSLMGSEHYFISIAKADAEREARATTQASGA